MAALLTPTAPSFCFRSLHFEVPFGRNSSAFPLEYKLSLHSCLAKTKRITRRRNTRRFFASTASYETETGETWDYQDYQALLRGGEVVTEVMKKMTELLEDISGMDAEDESVAVEIAAAGAVGHKLESLDGSFFVALDWMIGKAESEQDDKRKMILEVIKDTVLGRLTEKCPPHVQVIGMLCQTPVKEKRHEILRRSAGGGGTFDTESGGKLTIPKANLNDISTQADNFLTAMEEKRRVQDRRLLARLVLVREEARSMLGGGLLDKRNDSRGLRSLPKNVVQFFSKIVGLRPGPALHKMLSDVMNGNEEGEDLLEEEEDYNLRSRVPNTKPQGTSASANEGLPVRPGMFLEGLNKVLGGMYETNTGGVGVQQLEWIHRETLKILQKIAFS